METTHRRTPNACVIGAGRMGRALQAALERAGIDASPPWSRSSDRPLEQVLEGSGTILVAVPDDAVTDVLGSIAEHACGCPLVVVTSGSVQLAATAQLHRDRFTIARMHPLRVIATTGSPTSLRGAPCAIACDDPSGREQVRALATSFGMRPLEVHDDDAPAWHAAAVLSSNFVTTLLADSIAILEGLGVDAGDARAAATDLARSAIEAVAASGARSALTGPIARGDVGVVSAHRKALIRSAPQLIEAYDALAARTHALAAQPIGAER